MTAYDFFINSGWGFALTIIALISLVANIIQFASGRKTRKLLINFKTEPFGKAIKEIIDKYHLELDIPHFTKFIITCKNIGNTDLSKENFEAPIEYIFSANVEYINTEISDELILQDALEFKKDRVVISPFLLQQSEHFEISGFITSAQAVDKAQGRVRIKDFKIFNEIATLEQPIFHKFTTMLTILIVTIGLILMTFPGAFHVIGIVAIFLGFFGNFLTAIFEKLLKAKK